MSSRSAKSLQLCRRLSSCFGMEGYQPLAQLRYMLVLWFYRMICVSPYSHLSARLGFGESLEIAGFDEACTLGCSIALAIAVWS